VLNETLLFYLLLLYDPNISIYLPAKRNWSLIFSKEYYLCLDQSLVKFNYSKKILMKPLIFLFSLFLLGSTQLFSFLMAQSSTTSDGNIRSEIKRGERPGIDIFSFPDDAMETTVIRIRLDESLGNHLDQLGFFPNSDGVILFDISAIDQLNQKYHVSAIKKTFSIALQTTQYSTRHKQWGFNLWFDLYVPAETSIKTMVMEYAKLEAVKVAEPVYKKQLVGQVEPLFPEIFQPDNDIPNSFPNDPRYNEQWHYNNTGQAGGTIDADIDLPEAWELTKGNSNVIVAVLDAGISYTHPDLAANMWSGIGYNFVDNSPTVLPGSHGTHVAGTIAANTNNAVGVSGIAGGNGTGNGVRLMSCQIANPAWTISGGIENAFIWAADHGAAITQNSWIYGTAGEYEQSVLDAIDYFNANGGGTVLGGGITIFAAGNSNSQAQLYPACYSGVLSVAATNNKDKKAAYSTYNTWVDLSAPGGETSVAGGGVLSTYTGNSYAFLQGTSMACPHVSGVAALIISLAPGQLTSQNVKDILISTTDNIDALNPTYIGKLGSGRLNAYKAVHLTDSVFLNPSIPSPPQTFTANAINPDLIDLSWGLNATSDSVILAFNSSYIFGTPSGNYLPGQTITGGGTVLYKGKLTSYNHGSLNSGTAYYYALWSKNGTNYSVVSLKANDTTSATLPFTENFNSITIPPCWSQQISPNESYNWSVSNSSYAGGTTYEMKSTYVSSNAMTTRLVTPPISTTGLTLLTLSFRHAFYAYDGISETIKVQSSTNGRTWTDEIWSVTSNSNLSATTINTTVSHNLNNLTTYIAFTLTGNTTKYNWFIDDVSITAPCYWTGGTPGFPNDWNTASNWGYGAVPTALSNVYIPVVLSLPVINSTGMVCNDLVIENNASLTINTGKSLTVAGNLTVRTNNTGIILGSGASLKHSTPGVSGTVNRTILKNSQWHFLSCPIQQITMPEICDGNFAPSAGNFNSTTGATFDFLFWKEPPVIGNLNWINLKTSGWEANTADFGNPPRFVPGKGYLVLYTNNFSGNDDKVFTGTLGAGTIDLPVTASVGGNSYNLIGNPYPSYIDWKSPGWTRTVLASSGGGFNLYIWNGETGSYGVYNSASVIDEGTNNVTRYITPEQGFFIQASTSGNVTVTNDVRCHASNTWLKSSGNVLRLKVSSSANRYADEVMMEFDHLVKGGAEKWFSIYPDAPSLYLPEGDNKYSLRFLGELSETPVIPISFQAGIDGNYTLSIDGTETFSRIMLQDFKTGTVQEMKANPEYPFVATISDEVSRFLLKFTSEAVETQEKGSNFIFTYSNVINILDPGKSKIEVFDMMGKKIIETEARNESLFQIKLLTETGYYVVRVTNPQNVFTQKVFINQ
jgi:subtilisin family serine protease